MWIENLDNGKYKYVERYTDPLTGNNRKVSITNVKKNARVEKEMFILLQEKIKQKIETNSKGKQMTFGELCDEWMEVYKESVKLSSYVKTRHNLNILNSELTNMLVENVQSNHLNQFFLTSLKDERIVYSTAVQLKSVIARVLKFGQTYHGIKKQDVINELEIPKINVSKKNNYNYLEREELSQIVNHLDNTGYSELKRLVLIQVNTGMRFGEMASIDYKTDINFSDNSLHINKTFDYSNNIFTTPKSGDSRTIYFNSDIARLLKEQINFTKLLTMSRGLPKENTLLFKSIHGSVLRIRVLNSKFPKVGLSKRVTTHTLRHTFVSLAVEKGISKDLIAKQVGHTDTTMINEIYSHFTEGMREQQKEAMLDFKII